MEPIPSQPNAPSVTLSVALVADLHSPLALSENADGQKTGQDGLWVRFNTRLPEGAALPPDSTRLEWHPDIAPDGAMTFVAGIAFAVLLGFMFAGETFLRVMHLSERSLEVAGGVILLMVAIRMIFGHEGGVYGMPEGKEPLIFPLAVPLLAGPSAMATVLLLASRQPDKLMTWVGALTCAMLEQVIAAEHVERQVAIVAVIAVEEALLLAAVDGVFGGVEVERDAPRAQQPVGTAAAVAGAAGGKAVYHRHFRIRGCAFGLPQARPARHRVAGGAAAPPAVKFNV